jgi:hypothetical protein
MEKIPHDCAQVFCYVGRGGSAVAGGGDIQRLSEGSRQGCGLCACSESVVSAPRVVERPVLDAGHGRLMRSHGPSS